MDKLLTLEEVAEALRMPVATLRWMRHQGTAPVGFKVGRRVVFTETAVEEYVAQQQALSR